MGLTRRNFLGVFCASAAGGVLVPSVCAQTAQEASAQEQPLVPSPNSPIIVESYDFRSAVVAVVDRILAARAATPKGKPLFVLMGEEHTQSAHVVMQQMIVAETLRRVRGTQRIAFGYEAPHNFEEIVRNDSPVATERLNSFLHRQDISTCFNDVAGLEELDMEDKLTERVARALFPEKKDRHIDYRDPEGIAIRNRVIAAMAQEHTLRVGTDIYFQQTGAAHLFGFKEYSYLFEDSLYARLVRASQSVLSVNFFEKLEERIDKTARGAFDSAVYVRGLPNLHFTGRNSVTTERKLLMDITANTQGQYPYRRVERASSLSGSLDPVKISPTEPPNISARTARALNLLGLQQS